MLSHTAPNRLDLILADVDSLQSPLKRNIPLEFGSQGYDVNSSFLIKGIIPEKALMCIYGPSGSFKSFLALSWACHIASGKKWDGRKVIPGAVLYVAGEGGVGVRRRVRAWELQFNNGNTLFNLARTQGPIFPGDPSQIDELITTCERLKDHLSTHVSLIIIDTLARCFGGADENSARDMGAFIKGCDTLKQATGASVLIVHHSGKNEENGARGSSSLRAALDVEVKVNRDIESDNNIALTYTKMKDEEPPPSTGYELLSMPVHTDNDGEEITSLVLIDKGRELSAKKHNSKHLTSNHRSIWQAIQKRINNEEPTSYQLIREDLKAQGIPIKHYSRWIDKLVDDHVIIREGEILSMPV